MHANSLHFNAPSKTLCNSRAGSKGTIAACGAGVRRLDACVRHRSGSFVQHTQRPERRECGIRANSPYHRLQKSSACSCPSRCAAPHASAGRSTLTIAPTFLLSHRKWYTGPRTCLHSVSRTRTACGCAWVCLCVPQRASVREARAFCTALVCATGFRMVAGPIAAAQWQVQQVVTASERRTSSGLQAAARILWGRGGSSSCDGCERSTLPLRRPCRSRMSERAEISRRSLPPLRRTLSRDCKEASSCEHADTVAGSRTRSTSGCENGGHGDDFDGRRLEWSHITQHNARRF